MDPPLDPPLQSPDNLMQYHNLSHQVTSELAHATDPVYKNDIG